MKVYLVVHDGDDDWPEILGVTASIERAKELAAERNAKYDEKRRLDPIEWQPTPPPLTWQAPPQYQWRTVPGPHRVIGDMWYTPGVYFIKEMEVVE